MKVINEALEANTLYAKGFQSGDLPMPPGRKLAILACMDARLTVEPMLGLKTGDAHIIRNAGGIATEDAVRSLIISHHLLGTQEIMIINHTDCGMLTFSDDEFRTAIQAETGIRPPWAAEALPDPADDVRQSIARIVASPFVPHRDAVRGFVFDVASGRLGEVGTA